MRRLIALIGLTTVWQTSADLPATLDRIGARVEQYYAHARSIVCTETVRIQPLDSSLVPEGPGRQLVYELRVSWEPPADPASPPDPTVLRQIVTIDGRPPRAKDLLRGPRGLGCMDPKPVSIEPLAFLLPSRREEYTFKWAGAGRIDGKTSVMLEYQWISRRPPAVVWDDECVKFEVPAVRGRLWADATTGDVLRIDESLMREFSMRPPRGHARAGEQWVVERDESSIRYRQMAFHDPEESVMLPVSMNSITVIRNGAVPRLRIVQEFSNYKRFMTEGRLVR